MALLSSHPPHERQKQSRRLSRACVRGDASDTVPGCRRAAASHLWSSCLRSSLCICRPRSCRTNLPSHHLEHELHRHNRGPKHGRKSYWRNSRNMCTLALLASRSPAAAASVALQRKMSKTKQHLRYRPNFAALYAILAYKCVSKGPRTCLVCPASCARAARLRLSQPEHGVIAAAADAVSQPLCPPSVHLFPRARPASCRSRPASAHRWAVPTSCNSLRRRQAAPRHAHQTRAMRACYQERWAVPGPFHPCTPS